MSPEVHISVSEHQVKNLWLETLTARASTQLTLPGFMEPEAEFISNGRGTNLSLPSGHQIHALVDLVRL